MIVEVVPTTLISVGEAPATTLVLFCIVNFVSFVVSWYICSFVVGVVPIPTFPDVVKVPVEDILFPVIVPAAIIFGSVGQKSKHKIFL